MKTKTVVIYSGGMDSYTLLMDAVKHSGRDNVSVVSFDYGQRHYRELDSVRDVCKHHNVKFNIVDLRDLSDLVPGSSLTDPSVAVPEGHYEEESMKATVVPNRNMIMLSIASAHAIAIGAGEVLFGAHAGDHAIYPDCRSDFVQSMNQTVRTGNYTYPIIRAPYITLTKGQILERAQFLGIDPNSYKYTWTCYKGGQVACGKCGSCQERLEAFKSVGWVDPLPYEVDEDHIAQEAE